jgi:protein-S-isoprenylcysteine O-methyltransferase Ste14
MSVETVSKPFNQKKRLFIAQLMGVSAILVLLVSEPSWKDMSLPQQVMESFGTLLVLVCMFGRLWATLFVGSRKNVELVTTGPYSVTRNPLYLFSTIGLAGLGLVFGSIIITVILAALGYLVLAVTARKEAAFLRQRFADEYPAYEKRTPQFWPDPRLYNSPDEVTFSPELLGRAFRDTLYFLLLIPVIGAVGHLHDMGYLPVLFRIP